MDTNSRTTFLAKLDKDLRGVESPYTFRIVRGAGRVVRYRAKKKTGPMLRRAIPGPSIGLCPFIDNRRIA